MLAEFAIYVLMMCHILKCIYSSPLSVQSLVAFPKLKRQVLSYDPPVSSPKDFTDSTLFYVNQEFSLMYVTVVEFVQKHYKLPVSRINY